MVSAGFLSISVGMLLLTGLFVSSVLSSDAHRITGRHEIGQHRRGVIREESGLAILDGRPLGPGWVLYMDGTCEYLGMTNGR